MISTPAGTPQGAPQRTPQGAPQRTPQGTPQGTPENALFASLTPAERIIVALDCGASQAIALAEALQGQAHWLKVGMTLFYREGPGIVAALKEKGYKVFVDLKLHDIPHQVRGAAKSVVLSGADMLSIHASGGRAMMEAAREGALAGFDVLVKEAGSICSAKSSEPIPQVFQPITLGITVLTSMDTQTMVSVGIDADASAQVRRLTLLAHEAGLSGVVASSLEAQMLRRLLGPGAAIVTPGVRPAGSSTDDQSRVATPLAALEAGASHLVIGRPITEADDPVLAFATIVSEIERGLA